MKEDEILFTMCWFGFYQPYATSIVHVPEHVINPNEIDEKDLIFIWDKYMKADILFDLLGAPVPWSPALLEGYKREWIKKEDSLFVERENSEMARYVLRNIGAYDFKYCRRKEDANLIKFDYS